MSLTNELTWLDATAQAELVRTKEIKPIELVEAAIERIERVNPQISAVIYNLCNQAGAKANGDLPDGAFAGVPFTPLTNVTGQPSISLPLYWNRDGLPIGSHFAARFGDEATLFRLGAQLEAARPWADKRPPVSA